MKSSLKALHPQKFILDGSYELLASLRHSRRSVVYSASCLPSAPIRDYVQRNVALKLVLREKFDDAKSDVDREVSILSSLTHENIIELYDYIARDDLCYIVYELAPSGDVRKLLNANPTPISLARAFNLAEQLLEGLAYIHENSIVHRDIKPSNLLLFKEDRLRIADFGIAATLEELESSDEAQLGVGTLDYLAPEQLQFGVSNFATDIYAAAVTIFELFTGHQPIESICFAQGISARLTADYAHLSDYRSDCSLQFEAVMTKALAVDPKDRYSSAIEFLEALQQIKENLCQPTVRMKVDDFNFEDHKQNSFWANLENQTIVATFAACLLIFIILLQIVPGIVVAEKNHKKTISHLHRESIVQELPVTRVLAHTSFSGATNIFVNEPQIFQIATIPNSKGLRVVLLTESDGAEFDYDLRKNRTQLFEINGKQLRLEFSLDEQSQQIYALLTHGDDTERILMSPNRRV